MATENRILDLAYPAAEDLSDDQYRWVVLTTSGTVRRPDSETEVCLGILQNAPGAGEAASVRVIGQSKMVANAALAIGAFVKPEFVSDSDAGKGKSATGALKFARGRVMEAAGAEDDLASVLLISASPAVSDTITDPGDAGAIPVTESGTCPMASAGAETRTIAAPTFMGQRIGLICDTYVGDIVLTSAVTVNQTGNNTLTFGAAADACILEAMTVGGTLTWRITYNDGVALSTV